MVTIKARPAELAKVADQFKEDEQVRQMFFLSSGRLLLICTFVDAHNDQRLRVPVILIPEVMEYEIANVISVGKELTRAVVAPGLNPVMRCVHCNREFRDEPIRFRDSGRNHYLCSPECLDAYRLASSRAVIRTARASISTIAPSGRADTATVLRAGGSVPKADP